MKYLLQKSTLYGLLLAFMLFISTSVAKATISVVHMKQVKIVATSTDGINKPTGLANYSLLNLEANQANEGNIDIFADRVF